MSALARVELDIAELVDRCGEEAGGDGRGLVFDDDRGAGDLGVTSLRTPSTFWGRTDRRKKCQILKRAQYCSLTASAADGLRVRRYSAISARSRVARGV